MEELHGEVNAFEIPTFNWQITWLGGSTAEHHGIELLAQFRCRYMNAYRRIGNESDALARQEINAPLNNGFVKLHVGNPVHEESADAVGALVHSHPVTSTVQLGGTGEP